MVEVKSSIELQKQQAIAISAQLMEQLEKDLILLGLDEDQEKYLVALIDGKVSELADLLDKQEVIEEFFNHIISSLE